MGHHPEGCAMRVRMLSTKNGADDGVTVRTYLAGQEYELPATSRGLDLAQVFVKAGWAQEVKPEAVSAPVRGLVEPARPTLRLPLLDEYTASGYPADTYQAFIAGRTAEAIKEGLLVEVRAMTAAEEDDGVNPLDPDPVEPLPEIPQETKPAVPKPAKNKRR